MLITIRYGSGNTITRDFPAGTTLDNVLTSSAVRAGLGYGTNVEGQVGGVTQAGSLILQEGMPVTVVDKACSKAS